MKRLIALLLSICMILCLATACGSSTTEPEVTETASATIEGPIKIVVLAPVTGPAASDGVSMDHGINMAANEINEAGGVLGAKVEIVIEDVTHTADAAVPIAQLVANDGSYTACIGPHYSGQILACGDILAESGIPILTGGTTTSVLETITAENVIRVRTPDYIVAKAGAQFLAEDLNAQKVGVLYSNDDFGNGAMQECIAVLDGAGIDYVCQQFETADTDVTSQLLKLQSEGVDSLFVWSMGAGFQACMRQLYELGMNNLPTVCCPALSMDNITSQLDPTWYEGYYCTAHWLSNQTDELSVEFYNKYTSLYDDVPSMLSVAYYESCKWICSCIEKAQSTDAEAILAQMYATQGYETAYCTYNFADRDVCRECQIAIVKDGVLEPVKPIAE